VTKWAQRLFGADRNGGDAPAQATVDVDALIVEGNALEDAGEYDAALTLYRRAAQHAPDSARTHVNIGNALKLLGRIDEAIVAQRTALRLDPGHPGARCNLGALLHTAGDLAGAERELRAALGLKPDLGSAAILLAAVLAATGRTPEAEQALRGVLAAQPDEPVALHNLASLLMRHDRLDEAEDIVAKARSGGHDPAQLAGILGTLYSSTGRPREAEPLFREALARPELAGEVISPHLFTLNLRDDLSAAQIFAEHREFGAHVGAAVGSRPVTVVQDLDEARVLRVGYVSPDFRQHPVGLFIRPVLELHDRSCIEAHCYSNSGKEDDVTRALMASGARWRSIAGAGDDAAAEVIHRDRIDILVDLAGHTTDNRLALFARRVAPVQATWLGYLNTTGVPAMDYRLCDRHTDPTPESAALHTEQLVHLPESQWCYVPVYDVPSQRHERSRPGVVFGSFNQLPKLGDTCLGTWARVLAAVPDATLRIHGVQPGRGRDRLRERLARAGFDPARVELRERVGILEYFRAIEDVDVALDTWPYNGGTTTLDTLWMGTPLVALRGPTSVSRGAYSILTTLDLPGLVADTPARYVDLNVELARNVAWRTELHRALRQRLVASPLMDAPRFVRALEEAYRRMWIARCRTAPPS